MGCGKSSVDQSTIASTEPKNQEKIEEFEATKQNFLNPSDISILPSQSENPDVKILLLGASDSGKTTLFNQLKIIFCDGIAKQESENFKEKILSYFSSYAEDLIKFITTKKIEIPSELKESFNRLKTLKKNPNLPNDEMADCIHSIWQNQKIKNSYLNFTNSSNQSFYFDNAKKIVKDDFLPSNDDIIKAYIRTKDINCVKFKINDSIDAELNDVGGLISERKKWSKYNQQANCLIFVISLSDFDQSLLEDKSIKRLQDALNLFQSTLNSPYFKDKPAFIVFNKKDVFEEKLLRSPDKFREAFPDFVGDTNDVHACMQHVENTFMNKISPDRDSKKAWIEIIETCAIDKDSSFELFQRIAKTIFLNPPPPAPQIEPPAKDQNQEKKEKNQESNLSSKNSVSDQRTKKNQGKAKKQNKPKFSEHPLRTKFTPKEKKKPEYYVYEIVDGVQTESSSYYEYYSSS